MHKQIKDFYVFFTYNYHLLGLSLIYFYSIHSTQTPIALPFFTVQVSNWLLIILSCAVLHYFSVDFSALGCQNLLLCMPDFLLPMNFFMPKRFSSANFPQLPSKSGSKFLKPSQINYIKGNTSYSGIPVWY